MPTPSRIELPRINTPRPGETALNNAPIPYTIRPAVKHRLRPHRSVSLPPGIMRAAITSKNMVIAVCTPCTVVSRSSLMSLIITFMFEPAKLQMNCASASGTRIFRSDPDGRPTLDTFSHVSPSPPQTEEPNTRGFCSHQGGCASMVPLFIERLR